MNKNLIINYYNKLLHKNIINNTNKFIHNIIKKSKQNLPKILNYKHTCNKSILDQPIYLNSNFIDTKIKNYIIKNNNILYNFNIKYNNLNLIFNYYSNKKNIKFAYFDNIIKHILIFYSIFDIKLNKIHISIYDTPFKKELDNSNIFEPKHINSGFSIPYTKEIFIFRTEELYKVLIHELLHVFHLEIQENNINCGIYCDIFSIKSDIILVNEAIVELYAIIYNSILLSLKLYKKINISKIIEMLNLELQFNMYQTAKILHHSSFKSIDEFLCKCTNNILTQNNTSIVSYIIIKTILLFNINKINNYTNINNRELIDKLVIKFIKNKSYKNNINYYINDINNNNYIDKNLRMSLLS